MSKTALISHVTLATTFNENEFPRKRTFGTQITKMDWGYRQPSTDPYFCTPERKFAVLLSTICAYQSQIVPCSPFWRQTPFPSEWRSLFSQRAQTRVCRISSLVSVRNISRGTVTQFWIFRGETWNVSIGKEKLNGEKAFAYIFATQSNGLSTRLFTLLRESGPQHCSVSQE